MLGELEGTNQIVICDLEAGIGTISRLRDGHVDVFLIVVEPTRKSIEVASRVADAAEARGARVVIVANRVASPADLGLVESALGGRQVIEVPDDDRVRRADQRGMAPIDLDETGPAIAALQQLALIAVGRPVSN